MIEMPSWDEGSKECLSAHGYCPPSKQSCSKSDLYWDTVLKVLIYSLLLCEILKGIGKCTRARTHTTLKTTEQLHFFVHYITRTGAPEDSLSSKNQNWILFYICGSMMSLRHQFLDDAKLSYRNYTRTMWNVPDQGKCNLEFTGQIIQKGMHLKQLSLKHLMKQYLKWNEYFNK